MVIEIIQREIPTRGVGYIILRDCPEERLGEALGKGMEKLKKAGAKQVWPRDSKAARSSARPSPWR